MTVQRQHRFSRFKWIVVPLQPLTGWRVAAGSTQQLHPVRCMFTAWRARVSRELTKAIGETERTMRALLEGVVATRSVTFPEWTTLVFTTSPLAVDVIVQRQLHGYVVKTREEALEAISSLRGRAWIAPEANGEMKHTADGHVEFGELAFRVAAITRNLFQHLPESDIATTVRTLSLISDRARSLLSAGG